MQNHNDLDLLGRHDEIELEEFGDDHGGAIGTGVVVTVALSIAFCPSSACTSKCG